MVLIICHKDALLSRYFFGTIAIVNKSAPKYPQSTLHFAYVNRPERLVINKAG